MDQTLFTLGSAAISTWTIVGLIGASLFAGRWILQIYASHLKRQSVVPVIFWYMSVIGNILLLLYFIFGMRDFVGIISNIFPIFVASYNILLIKKARTRTGEEVSGL